MAPKKKKSSSSTKRRRYGSWFTIGQILIILGAALIIAAAIVNMVQYIADPNTTDPAWQSYTFGFLHVIVGMIIAIVLAVAIIWIAADRRVYYRLNLYFYAVIVIVLALLAGNIGSLVIVIGALIIIFYKISRTS